MKRMLISVTSSERTDKSFFFVFFKQSNLYGGVCMYEELCWKVSEALRQCLPSSRKID